MTRILALLAASLAIVLAVSPASALTREEFVTLVKPMSDLEANKRLEKEFSALVAANDEAAIKTLGERIRAEHGAALDKVVALAERQAAAQPTDPVEAARQLAERLQRDAEGKPKPPLDPDKEVMRLFGPCDYAGVLLRNIVTWVAKGEAKPVFRKDTVMIDDNDSDMLFAENMDRCELIQNKRSPARLIGNRCMTTGQGCMDDPDLADQYDDEKK